MPRSWVLSESSPWRRHSFKNTLFASFPSLHNGDAKGIRDKHQTGKVKKRMWERKVEKLRDSYERSNLEVQNQTHNFQLQHVAARAVTWWAAERNPQKLLQIVFTPAWASSLICEHKLISAVMSRAWNAGCVRAIFNSYLGLKLQDRRKNLAPLPFCSTDREEKGRDLENTGWVGVEDDTESALGSRVCMSARGCPESEARNKGNVKRTFK